MQLLGQEPLRRGKSVRGWQDLRAVHDLRASDGESAPWRQDARAVHSPTALCGSFWIHGTHILPKLAVFEYMQAICCREPVFFPSEAPSGTHRGDILPWVGSTGTHQDDFLPWLAAWEYTTAIYRHSRTLENASRRYIAMAERLETHQGSILPWLNAREHISATSCRESGPLHKPARKDEEHGGQPAPFTLVDQHEPFAQVARHAPFGQSDCGMGTKKAPLRRAAPSPQTTGANQIRPES